jgi:tetratricopeptide (TPR) repeat protein
MKSKVLSAAAIVACISLSLAANAFSAVVTGHSIAQEKTADLKVSKEEADAAAKIDRAVGPAAKLQAGAEFLKKYPKSVLRPRIASSLAGALSNVADAAQRIALVETYLGIFKEPGEAEHVNGTLLDAYLIAERAEDAFRLGAAWLEKHPDDVDVMRRLSIVSSNEAIRGNSKFVEQGNKYGIRAIELIEADKKPASADATQWAEYKVRVLPSLYREAGILALRLGNKADARAKLEKAAGLKTPDPVVYAIVGQLYDEEYATMASQYKAMPGGSEKEATLQKVQNLMDKVIEYYAQAMGAAGDKAQYEQMRSQLRSGLEQYYKFRHNGSMDGLQQLIDKYKQPAATP